MSTFHYDNPIIRMMIHIANLIILSFLWVLCCLPVLTIVPSSAALYHTIVKVVRTDGTGVVRDFFRTFAKELKTGVVLSFIFLVLSLFIAYGIYIALQMWQNSLFGLFYLVFGIILVLLIGPALLYLSPTLSRFQSNSVGIIRLSLYFASQHPLRSLGMIVLFFLVAFLIDFYPLLLMILPGIYVDLIAGGMEKTFLRYIDMYHLTEETGTSETTDPEPEQTDVYTESSLDMEARFTNKEEENRR